MKQPGQPARLCGFWG